MEAVKVAQHEREFDNRFSAFLMDQVPDYITMQVKRGSEEEPCAVELLEELIRFVSPGGEVEASSLREFLKRPGSCEDVVESKQLLADWKMALSRLLQIGSVG